MGIRRTPRLLHWDYFLSLEDDLLGLSRYVDFSGNEETYSIEIARVLLAASSETDVVLKGVVKSIDPDSGARSINAYFPVLHGAFPGFFDLRVFLHRYGLELTPWVDWTQKTVPFWWTANNKIKHERSERFADANLKHCINSVAGLFVANLYLYREAACNGDLFPPASLFWIGDMASNAMNAHPPRYYYRLPGVGRTV